MRMLLDTWFMRCAKTRLIFLCLRFIRNIDEAELVERLLTDWLVSSLLVSDQVSCVQCEIQISKLNCFCATLDSFVRKWKRITMKNVTMTLTWCNIQLSTDMVRTWAAIRYVAIGAAGGFFSWSWPSIFRQVRIWEKNYVSRTAQALYWDWN